jgi:hypothetical protein
MRLSRKEWMVAWLMALCGNALATEVKLQGQVTAVRGNVVELSIGSEDGVRRGMVFVTKVGNGLSAVPSEIVARFEVTAVSVNRSTARIVQKVDVVTVGDPVELADGASPAPVKPVIVPPPPTQPTPKPPTPIVSPAPSAEAKEPVLKTKATIAAMEGDKFIISAGRVEGLESGMTVSIVRDGQRVARLYVERAEAQQSVAKLFNVERGVFFAVGDEITLTFQPSGELPTPPLGLPEARLPTLPQFTVPRTERAYDLLGALASDGLITRYPARVFHEDSPFQSRAESSIVFTRAQIAGLINEALENVARTTHELVSHGSIVALLQLVREYERELRMLRGDFESVQGQLVEAQSQRSRYGFGGFARFGAVSGRGEGIPPRTEFTQPSDSAFDLRFNLFANLSRRIRFAGQFDTNSENGRSTVIRRAQLTMDDAFKLPLLGRVQVEVGRGDFWYGAGRFSTLLLSDTGGPYDYVKTRYRIGADFLYEGFVTSIGDDPRKNLYGHRLETRVGNNVRLGVAETLLTAEQAWNGGFLLTTFVPTLPLVTVDRIRNNANTNPVSLLYAEANVANGLQLYSEYLIDDLVLREKEPLPHRTGFLIGAQGFLAKNPLKFNGRLEFVRLQPGVYQSNRVIENYFRGDRPIGYILSTPDPRVRGVNSIHLDLNYMPIRKLTLGFGVALADLEASDPMLSRQNIIRLRALFDIMPNLAVGVRAVRTSTTNDNFVPDTFLRNNRLEFHLLRTF